MNTFPRLIPAPASIKTQDGVFRFDQNTSVCAHAKLSDTARFLADLIRLSTGYDIPIRREVQDNAVCLDTAGRTATGAYELTVTPERIIISAADEDGVFAGCRTLRQLLPPDIESPQTISLPAWDVPCVTIQDAPRFTWRGLMIDPARTFYTPEDIKRVIDIMCLYGLNRLHIHLTDDQGWRMEVPGYPALTAGQEHYTREQIREIVEYARKRQIMSIPEFDMPGHTTAAVSAYPDMSCRGVNVSKPSKGGNFGDIFCPGNDELYDFIRDILAAAASVFPAPFIHIGGDETVKDNWKVCPKCRKRMEEEHLKDLKALEHYFVSRVERIIRDLGRRMIGWDEILELDAEGIGHEVAVTYPSRADDDPLEPGTVIQSWRDLSGLKAATALGHNAIGSNVASLYINRSSRNLPLEKVYAYDPAPKSVGPEARRHILGVEACFWGGKADRAYRETRLLPRLCAVAEVGWCPSERKDIPSLRKAILRHRRRWKVMGYCSHPVGWVDVVYDHPDCEREDVSEFEVVFRVANSADEPAVATASLADASEVAMTPAELEVNVGPGETETLSAVFKTESGWDIDYPCPFTMNWRSVFGDVSEAWCLNVAPEKAYYIPEGRPDGTLDSWNERMPFTVSRQARFGLCRNGGTVYCAVYVEKDALHLDPHKPPYEQDGVEIRFDLRSDRDRFFSDGEREFKDIIPICVSPGMPTEAHGAFYRKDALPEGVQTVCRPVDGGYLTETSLPCDRDAARVNICVNLSDGAHIEKRSWRPRWRSGENFPWSGTFYFGKP